MTIHKSFLLIILSTFIFFRCSDEPTSIGKDIGQKNLNLITLNSSDDSLMQTSSYYHPDDIRFSASSRIHLGKSDNVTSSILIRFTASLPDSIKNDIINNSIIVSSSVIDFIQVYRFGEESAPLDFSVHKINSNWSVNFTNDSLPQLQYDQTDSKLSVDMNDSVTSITLNNQLVQDWLKIIADTSLRGNYGVYIKPLENSQKILGYQAITSTFENVPLMNVVIEKQGEYTDTLSLISSIDLSVVEGNIPTVSNENIIVRSGYIINSKLFFDLSPLPENIVVNKAELVLTLDTLETRVGDSYTQSLQAFFLFDSTNTDSISSSSVSLSKSGNTFKGNITNYVRAWLDNNINNGILISHADALYGFELFAIKGSNAAINNKPLLLITYTKIN